MRTRRWVAVSAATVLLLILCAPRFVFASTYEYTYWLLDHPDGAHRYRLSVSITPSLYEYYHNKDHNLYGLNFDKFVTPSTLKPIADDLWSIYTDDEDFANGVLMIVHQIPYEESAPQKYPVETIVENKGDCDLFSFIAASIMIAGGLDTVLLYYEEEKHMNVGVSLSHEPDSARWAASYFLHAGNRYYVAECTAGNWETGWRVGELPDELKDASAQVITLDNFDQGSPAQVSSSYSRLAASSITLTLSSTYIIQGNTITIAGVVLPAGSNRTVTIYLGTRDSRWVVLETVMTDSGGQYIYLWNPQSAGTYYIRTSWSGDEDHVGADSNIYMATVVSSGWLLIAIITIVLAGLIVVMLVLLRHSMPAEIPITQEATEDYAAECAEKP